MSNTIPVVALKNLDPSDQLELFMQINENQKAVSPTLRITLEEVLYWNASRLDTRLKALRSSVIRALGGEPITIYGDGKQVRDILHVSDAVAAYRAVLGAIDRVSGRAFNLGGGPANAVSLRIVLDEIARHTAREVQCRREGWRATKAYQACLRAARLA